ncbi:hypothetical protein B0E51_07145 [Rhodanobacter sp. C05]|nr:hypothetical protein B0E51_07145 [Rhodanobacter sp. C05]
MSVVFKYGHPGSHEIMHLGEILIRKHSDEPYLSLYLSAGLAGMEAIVEPVCGGGPVGVANEFQGMCGEFNLNRGHVDG